ncbi:hypothetical protein BDQ94DRAFT_141764 [Aspergillus welwitschiae]|uniref:Uncharacterized protein n=1 Tax=Aspergillus welwitschiae TaxID=1341132 RepID=A0A3F3Q691_9EURO|nr:hypothetical protein BDQ94DRAFT_141764 [Aspergillus welwitschiae]RDH34567.1 hypothetical protein BDQ94DRAFT_141764 [Aspergillus welwitschiae]
MIIHGSGERGWLVWTPVEASVLLFSFFFSSAAGTFPWGLRLLRLCLTSDCYHILTRSDPVNLTVRRDLIIAERAHLFPPPSLS